MKKPVLISAVFFTILGFIAWDVVHTPVELETKPIILGHGGMGVRSLIPLDSKTSIEKAIAYPIQGTELDVKITADFVLVAFHDEELQTCTSCSGNVASSLYSEIENCEYKSLLYTERIATVQSILEMEHADSTLFSFDLKLDPMMEGDFLAGYVTQVIKMINDFPQYRFVIESQSIETLNSLKFWNVRAGLYFYGHRPSSAIQLASENELTGISIDVKQIRPNDMTQAKKAGLRVMLWGCGDVFSNRKTLLLNADIIQTDDIASMVRLLALD